jgi:hypothetical protein
MLRGNCLMSTGCPLAGGNVLEFAAGARNQGMG